jgi:hypothetical protein
VAALLQVLWAILRGLAWDHIRRAEARPLDDPYRFEIILSNERLLEAERTGIWRL